MRRSKPPLLSGPPPAALRTRSRTHSPGRACLYACGIVTAEARRNRSRACPSRPSRPSTIPEEAPLPSPTSSTLSFYFFPPTNTDVTVRLNICPRCNVESFPTICNGKLVFFNLQSSETSYNILHQNPLASRI